MTNTPPIEALDSGHATSPLGYRAAAGTAGIKPSGKPDLSLLVSDTPAVWAGVFTQNAFCAYNIERHRRLLAGGGPLRAVVVTSGNANVATGPQGEADTEELAALVGQGLDCPPEQVAVAQTGVIGVPLPMEGVRRTLPHLPEALSTAGGQAAAEAICTTDTFAKHHAVRCELAGTRVTVGGMAKGAGMIHPNMATLLCFVTTDAAVAAEPLAAAWREAVAATLNTISIDGDQSTSDTALALANGAAGGEVLTATTGAAFDTLVTALTTVLEPLAAAIARDGEGATKLVVVTVDGAAGDADARRVARAVVASNLVKCAMYGADPNWGRIAAAVGNSGARVDPSRLCVTLNGMRLYDGAPLPFDRAAASQSMRAERIEIALALRLGTGRGRGYGCDLTEGYVRFNAEYTT